MTKENLKILFKIFKDNSNIVLIFFIRVSSLNETIVHGVVPRYGQNGLQGWSHSPPKFAIGIPYFFVRQEQIIVEKLITIACENQK
jgi:hypothetical protein